MALLEQMGDPEADVLLLKHFEDLTFQEIAERLESSILTSTGTCMVSSLIERANERANRG